MCYRFNVCAAYSEKNQNTSSYQECEGNTTASDGKVCRFHLDKQLGPCSKANDYGYKTGNPCVFLKLNKVRLVKVEQNFVLYIRFNGTFAFNLYSILSMLSIVLVSYRYTTGSPSSGPMTQMCAAKSHAHTT